MKAAVDPHKYHISLYLFLGALALAVGLNIALIVPYILALLIGVMLTVLSRPLYRYLRKKKWGPKLAGTLVVAAILFLLIVPVGGFLAVAVKQAIAFGQQLSEKDGGFSIKSIAEKISEIGPVGEFIGGPEKLEAKFRSSLQNSGKFLSGAVLVGAKRFPDLVLQLFISLITVFFLLQDGGAFTKWLSDKLPLDNDVQKEVSKAFKDTSVSVVWSTLAAAAVQAILMFAAFLLLGVPGAFLAAGATFIFAWIPILGSTPVWVLGIIYLVSQSNLWGAGGMLVAGIITGVSDNFVRPLILKGRGDMHPLVSLVVIFGGIELFGIFGVFIGPVLAGIMIALFQIWPVIGRRFEVLPPHRAKA